MSPAAATDIAMTTPAAALTHTEAAVHAQLILHAAVALGHPPEAFKSRYRNAAVAQIAFATGLDQAVVERVITSPEYFDELDALQTKLRENPHLAVINEKLVLLAMRGIREIQLLLEDKDTSRSKKVDTAFKLLDRIGLAAGAANPVANLINTEAVNILQINGGLTPHETETIQAIRDRMLGKPTPTPMPEATQVL